MGPADALLRLANMLRWWRDILLVAGVWFFVAFLSGAQQWVSLDTPDSEFHASMAIYANDVTDRVQTPVYYWTRLGYIAPAHALTSLLGPVTGLEVYRLVLLAIIVSAVFLINRRFTGRFNATVLTLLVASNTVMLGYLGNPYPTATAMAAMFVLVALALVPRGWLAPLGAGVMVGWLVMTSPYGAILGVVMYAAVLLVRDGRELRGASVARAAMAGVVGAAVGFGVFWLIGRALFPKLDWLSTYIFWNSALKQADYIVDPMRWTYDPSMLVPAMAVLLGVGAWLRNRGSGAARVAAVLASVAVSFSLVYWMLLPNNYLEIPHYQAMLWVAALVTMSLAAAARLPEEALDWNRGGAAAVAVAIVIGAGHSTAMLPLWVTRLAALAAVVAFVLLGRRWLAVLAVTVLVFAVAQLLQISRDAFGVSTSHLYANAYLDNEASEMMHSATQAESWLIDRTEPGERVFPWVDAEWPPGEQHLLPLAGFQLWGANEAEHGPLVTEETIRRWNAGKPTSIVMYGKSMRSVLDFWNGIPKERRPSVPECIEVPWTQPAAVKVCVTHLSW